MESFQGVLWMLSLPIMFFMYIADVIVPPAWKQKRIALLRSVRGQDVVLPAADKGGEAGDTAEHDTEAPFKLLYWRQCMLCILPLPYLATVLMACDQLRTKKESYEELVQAFPSGVESYADDFALALWQGDVGITAATAGSLVLATWALASVLYNPLAGHPRSVQLLRWSWVLTNGAPFAMLLGVPFRAFVDWRGLKEQLCLRTLADVTRLYPNIFEYIDTGIAAGVVDPGLRDPPAYCAAHVEDWAEDVFENNINPFIDFVADCSGLELAGLIYRLDLSSQREALQNARTIPCSAEKVLKQRLENQQTAKQLERAGCDQVKSVNDACRGQGNSCFNTMLSAFEKGGVDLRDSEEVLGCLSSFPEIVSVEALKDIASQGGCDGQYPEWVAFGEQLEKDQCDESDVCPCITPDWLTTFSLSIGGFQQATYSASEALESSEHGLGIIMGFYSAQFLIPICMAFLTALVATSANLKDLLPELRVLGYFLLLGIGISVPLYAAFLSVVMQVIGTAWLVPAQLCLLLALGAFALGGRTFTAVVTRAHLRRKVMALRAVQVLALVAAVGFLLVFVYSEDNDLLDNIDFGPLLDYYILANIAVDYVSKLILTTVVVADFLCSLVLGIHTNIIQQRTGVQRWTDLEHSFTLLSYHHLPDQSLPTSERVHSDDMYSSSSSAA